MTANAKRPPSTITVHVPLKLTYRGGRTTIVGQMPQISHSTKRSRCDNPIIKAIARAYRWRSLIEDGTYASITELAKAKGVNQSYACRLLRLTLLAPDLIEALLDRQEENSSLGILMRPLPANWIEQRTGLHLSNSGLERKGVSSDCKD